MDKDKKPWYIWFSVVAFMLLSGDTARRIKFSPKNVGLWNRASIHIMKLWGFYVMFIPICLAIILGLVLEAILSNGVVEGSIVEAVVIYIVLLAIYCMGIYATYRHSKWRNENIAHLLPGYVSPSEDTQTDDNSNI